MDGPWLFERLSALSNDSLPMHMPGHKRRVDLAPYLAALSAGLDITEIEGFDNLHDPQGLLLELSQRAAALYGAHASFPLVNGSTGGILAGVSALSQMGDKVLLQRGSHLSVYNAIAIRGLKPVYLHQPVLPGPGCLGSLQPETLEAALRQHPDARMLILTCPSYEGVLSDLDSLVAAAHRAGLKVLIDAAHGAHLGLSAAFPSGALSGGADIVVHSLHKTLPSLTQTALAHARDEATAQALGEQLDNYQTTSPSYLLLAAIDGCLRLLASRGQALLPAWRQTLDQCRDRCGALRHLRLYQGKAPMVWGFDPSKLLIDCSGSSITGTELMRRLREAYGIELETAGPRQALAMTGLPDGPAQLDRLAEALIGIDAGLSAGEGQPPLSLQEAEVLMPPGRALSLPHELVPIKSAAGRICAELVSLYPPGVPLLVPGEQISQGMADLLAGQSALYSRSKRSADHIAVLS